MKNKKVRRIVSCIIALAMTVTLLSGCGSKKDTENDIQDEPENTEEATAEPEASEGMIMSSLTVKVFGANETGAISGAEITLKSGDIEETAKCAEDGTVTFADLQEGDYSLECSADGFYDRETDIRINNEDMEYVMPMVPEISGDDAMVLLTWEGDHDLDLCAFNTSVKEYVNIGHPMDSEENVFLYADHGADQPYEVIYIHNASEEVARSIFITEAKNARNGEPSSMEADGVRIQVFDKNGLSYDCEPSADEDAALWCPCYIYASTVYDQGDYISDASGEQYAWISFEEKDAYTADVSSSSEAEWKDAYLKLLNSNDNLPQKAALIYINDDDIPEFVTYNDYSPVPISLYACVDGSSKEIVWYCHTLEYYPKGELFYKYNGMDEGYVGVEKWDGKNCTELWGSGLIDGEDWVEIISDEEAEKQVSKYFDRSKSTDALEDAMSIDEMIAYLSGSSATSAPTDTPTATVDWKQAYSAFINSNSWNSDDMFSFLYIDKDDVPELVVENVDLTTVYIYKSGAVTKYEEYSNWGAHGVMHDFYEGYISSSGAGDAGPLDSECPYFYSLDPVFDESLDSYCENEYDIIEEYEYETGVGKDDHERATEYFKNGKEISYEQYKSETDRIMNKPCKVWANGSKAEVLKQLDK